MMQSCLTRRVGEGLCGGGKKATMGCGLVFEVVNAPSACYPMYYQTLTFSLFFSLLLLELVSVESSLELLNGCSLPL